MLTSHSSQIAANDRAGRNSSREESDRKRRTKLWWRRFIQDENIDAKYRQSCRETDDKNSRG